MKKKTDSVTIPKSWLIAGALVLLTAVGVKAAINSSTERPQIDEVKIPAVQQGTYTGTISREVMNGKENERYVLTTDAGTKYVLIGLKKTYEDKGKKNENRETNGKDQRQKDGKNSEKGARPNPSPKADKEDVESFEQYLGKKVTITGMVVPESGEKRNNPSARPSVSMSPKGNKPEKSPKGDKKNDNKVNDNMMSDYDRLIVKDIATI